MELKFKKIDFSVKCLQNGGYDKFSHRNASYKTLVKWPHLPYNLGHVITFCSWCHGQKLSRCNLYFKIPFILRRPRVDNLLTRKTADFWWKNANVSRTLETCQVIYPWASPKRSFLNRVKDLNKEFGLEFLIKKIKSLYAKDINAQAFITYD